MSETDGDGSLPEDQRCKRSDGKRWRCRRSAMEGKTFCQAHFLQSCHRQNNESVPDSLKLEGARRTKVVLKIEESSTHNDVESPELPRQRGKRKRTETSVEFFDYKSSGTKTRPNFAVGSSGVPRRTRSGKKIVKENSIEISEQLEAVGKMKGSLQLDLIRGCLKREVEKEQEKPLVKELKYGRMEIVKASPSDPQPNTVKQAGSRNMKIGVSASRSVPTRRFRSKNIEPRPVATVQILPSIKANIKSSAKKKNIKKCHWCKWTGYRVFVKCLTCKKLFFCEECIDERFHDRAAVKRECPVCLGTCCCRTCTRGRPKEVKTKELVVYNREKKFDKTQQLHMIRLLLPLMEQMNQEKIIELDTEAKNKGKACCQLQVQLAGCSRKQKCCFCKAWVPDAYRSCESCSYILCILCCQEFRDGYLHWGLEDLKNMRTVRSKSLSKILWKLSADGSIRCPPRNLGGCAAAFLKLTCLSPFSWTKDLEASAKQIVCKYKFKKPFGVASSSCSLCEGNDEMGSEKAGNLIKNKGLYFSTKQDLTDKNLEHFMKHWGKGQPLIIRDVLQSHPELSWDFGFMFCKYLERSAESGKDTETAKSKSRSDWCDVQFYRKQIFVGGKTHANVWQECLKFKVWLPLGVFQDQFPNHYAAVMQALPVQEYINPLTGSLNLAVNLPHETQNPNLGPYVYISYGGPEDFMEADGLKKLCYHAYDMVNILAYATEHPISEEKLNEVKILMIKSQDQVKSSRKIRIRNKLEELFESSSGLEDDTNGELTCMPNGEVHVLSDDSSIGDSDDEDFSQYEIGSSSCYGEEQVLDTCGAEWDIFRREDVPKVVEFLRKYSDKLNKSYGSPKKVVHPFFDEIFYLDDMHKMMLKLEFDVEPWSFKQDSGEAVIIPAGCPYQFKKIKSCVNVVLEFISPESASECIKVSDELRQLPVNHKAKGKIPEVKKMAINGMHAAIEEIRKVSQTYNYRSGTPWE